MAHGLWAQGLAPLAPTAEAGADLGSVLRLRCNGARLLSSDIVTNVWSAAELQEESVSTRTACENVSGL